MTAIQFDCTKGCGAVLKADLGTGQNFGPCNTDAEARDHAARRRQYIGGQVETALLAHLIFDCPSDSTDLCAVCATPVDADTDVCEACRNVLNPNALQQQGGQQ